MYGRYAPYFFVAPGLLLLVVFFAYPLLDTLYLSLHRYNIFSPATFVGLDNFRRAWGDELFWRVLANTLLYAIIVVPALVVLSFFMALLLDNSLRLIKIFRTLYYIPVVTSIVVAGIVWKWLYNADGLLNAFLKGLGVSGPSWLADVRGVPEAFLGLLGVETQAAWLTEPAIALFAVAMVTVWKAAPYYMIIYLAGLQGIPAQLKEAARVDGAGWWQVVRHVIIPTIQALHARGFHHRHYRRFAHLRGSVRDDRRRPLPPHQPVGLLHLHARVQIPRSRVRRGRLALLAGRHTDLCPAQLSHCRPRRLRWSSAFCSTLSCARSARSY